MSEMTIKISDDGSVAVEEFRDGVKSFKAIPPDELIKCINSSLIRGIVSSGLLPKNCISFTAHDNGERDVCLLHNEQKADISYFGTTYEGFPLTRLVFGFNITKENRISKCRMGVVADESNVKPTTPMFVYPFSNVSGFSLCTGNNALPKCENLHTLGSLPYFILSMPNNNDYFKPTNNKQGLEMRDLLELLKDKNKEFYYQEILMPSGATLDDFINDGRC